MRRLIIVILINLALGIGLVGSAILVGRTQPLPTRLEYFHLNYCKFPCWLGIEVGKTTVGEAKRLLKLNFPKAKYTFEFLGVIALRERLTMDRVFVSFNGEDPFNQPDTTIIMELNLMLGEIYPLTAGELFNLIGEPEKIGIFFEHEEFQSYTLYCALGLRAAPNRHPFAVASPTSEMNIIDIYFSPVDACDAESVIAWEGFSDTYEDKLFDAVNRH